MKYLEMISIKRVDNNTEVRNKYLRTKIVLNVDN